MSDERPGSDGLPNSWLFEMLTRLEQRQSAHSAEMRAGFASLRDVMNAHQRDDDRVAGRVLVIETERKGERDALNTRMTWIGIIVPASMIGIVEAVKRLFR